MHLEPSREVARVGHRHLDEDHVGVERQVVVAADLADLVGILLAVSVIGFIRNEPDRTSCTVTDEHPTRGVKDHCARSELEHAKQARGQ